jgi:hypothetical protein
VSANNRLKFKPGKSLVRKGLVGEFFTAFC